MYTTKRAAYSAAANASYRGFCRPICSRKLLSQPRHRSVAGRRAKTSTYMLTTDQKTTYERDGTCARMQPLAVVVKVYQVTRGEVPAGYLVIRNFTSATQLQELQSRGVQLIEGFDPEQVSVFSTKNQVMPHQATATCRSSSLILCSMQADQTLRSLSTWNIMYQCSADKDHNTVLQ